MTHVAPLLRPAAAAHAPARPMLGLALRLGSVLAFGCMGAGVKLASEGGAHPLETIFYRFLFGFLPLAAWLAAGPGWGAVRTRRPGAHLWRAAVGLAAMIANF